MILAKYNFLDTLPFITLVMRWVACSMVYLDSSACTSLDLGYMCPKDIGPQFPIVDWVIHQIYTHFLPRYL